MNIPFTRLEIEDYVESLEGVEKCLKTRLVEQVLPGCSTVSEFLNLRDCDIVNKMSRVLKGRKPYAGELLFRFVHEVQNHFKELAIDMDKADKEREAQEKAEAEARKRAEEEERDRNPMFTKAQIKSLFDMMDFCNISEIDLAGITRLFKTMKVSVPAA